VTTVAVQTEVRDGVGRLLSLTIQTQAVPELNRCRI